MIEKIEADFVKKEIEKYKLRYWDFRISQMEDSSIFFWNKELKQLSQSELAGFGVRVLIGNGWGFSASNNLSKEGVRKSIEKAVKIASLLKDNKEQVEIPEIKNYEDRKILGEKTRESLEEKKKFLSALNYEIKNEIKSVYLRYRDIYEKKLFLSSFSEIEQDFGSSFLAGGILASQNNKNEEQVFRTAHLGSLNKLEDSQEKLNECIKNTKLFLKADKGKGGKCDAVLSGSIAGLFAHEALGHASEADLVLQGASCLRGLIGKKLAGEKISILDDPTQDDYDEWGSYYYDDEGTKARKNYIIKNGVLNSYLHSLETAAKLKMQLTGNGRAEDAMSKQIVRMSNTYVEKGDMDFNEMIEEIKEGYYLKGFKGGETDPAEGGFQFGAQEAYYVKNGKIIKPVKGVGFGGRTLEVLNKIKFVENKYSEDSPGFCGKMDQKVFAGGLNPAVLVKEIVLI